MVIGREWDEERSTHGGVAVYSSAQSSSASEIQNAG